MFRSEATGEEDQATAEDQHEEEAEKTQTVTETINETNLLHIELDITYICITLKICILRNLLLLVLYLPHIYHFLLHVNPQNKHLLLKPC